MRFEFIACMDSATTSSDRSLSVLGHLGFSNLYIVFFYKVTNAELLRGKFAEHVFVNGAGGDTDLSCKSAGRNPKRLCLPASRLGQARASRVVVILSRSVQRMQMLYGQPILWRRSPQFAMRCKPRTRQ